MLDEISDIHFEILKPINKRKDIIIQIVLVILFIVSLFVTSGFSNHIVWCFISYIFIFLLQILYINHYKNSTIGKGVISKDKIELLGKSYSFKEIKMCWFHFGFAPPTSDENLTFYDLTTLQMTLVIDHKTKQTFHLKNNLKEFKILSDELINLKRSIKTFKIQFHKTKKFDEVEFHRRVDVKDRYLESLPIRKLRKFNRKNASLKRKRKTD